MITGLNHITLSVCDLEQSLLFYKNLLGADAKVKWRQGAYLELGGVWLCLSFKSSLNARGTQLIEKRKTFNGHDYSHIAWSVSQEHFQIVVKRLKAEGVVEWQANRSEGESFYFLDPDDHRLELHVGDLKSRLASLQKQPYEDCEWL